MSNLKLQIGCTNYDRVNSLFDGSVKIEGVDAKFTGARVVTEIFKEMIKGGYDVAELGMTYFLRTIDFENSPFLALPIFPNRCFRHSAIYINVHKGIESPRDLNGKSIGEFAVYGHDAGVMPKGMLSDEFGFKPETCRWIVGGLDWPMPAVDFIPQLHPVNVEVEVSLNGTDLGAMLERGEIDALISADVPKCILDESPNVAQLFPNSKAAEQDYFKRTGIFPIMHTIAIRKELVAEHPELPKKIYDSFCQAKDAAMKKYKWGQIFNNMDLMLPWVSQVIAEDQKVLGEDWWPYGLSKNEAAVDAFLRYHFEQGLSKRRLYAKDVFVPSLLNT